MAGRTQRHVEMPRGQKVQPQRVEMPTIKNRRYAKPRLVLPATTTPPVATAPSTPNSHLLECAPPSDRTGPVFELALRRPILLLEAGDKNWGSPDIYPMIAQEAPLAGVAYTFRDIYFGIDARFEQTWHLTDVTIGDLASTMSLAPREQVTVEVQTSQRKVLDQATVDSTEAISSSESTTSDKEAVNVARASSKTEGWHVDGSATVTCGYASASVSAGYAKSITESNQQTINHVTEATRKSAKNLKVLHKIDVRGVSETFVQNRMTRVMRNPFNDRTLSINVFQLLKHFSVATDLTDLRAAMILRIETLAFDAEFVRNHVDFLRGSLIDAALMDDLPSAVRGAKPTVQSGARDLAAEMSQRALRYLFNLDEAENWTPGNIFGLDSPDTVNSSDPNDPQQSFMTHAAEPAAATIPGLSPGDVALGFLTAGASLIPDAAAKTYQTFMDNEKLIQASSGFETAVRTKSSALFATLAYFNAVVRDSGVMDASDSAKENAILLASALASDLQLQWDKLYPDPLKSDELHAMMGSANFTEVFRRVPGFIALVREVVRPLVEPAGADFDAIVAHNQDAFTLARLINHLSNYGAYYTERFLQYLSETTNNQAVSQFAIGALSAVLFPFEFDPSDFDLDHAFLDRREIVVPSFGVLDQAALIKVGQALGLKPDAPRAPIATVEEIDVPCDGVHFEVAQGQCVLDGVPVDQAFPATMTGISVSLPQP